jgi:hypothetical protein
MNENTLLAILQGQWIEDGGKMKIVVSGDDLLGITENQTTKAKLFLRYIEGLERWNFAVPQFTWAHVFMEDITPMSFTLLDFPPTGSILIDPVTKKLSGYDRVFKFKKLGVVH